MKKLLLLLLIYGSCLFVLGAYAQCGTAVQNLVEDFNTLPDPNNLAVLPDCWGVVSGSAQMGSGGINLALLGSSSPGTLVTPDVENGAGAITFKARKTTSFTVFLSVGYYTGGSFKEAIKYTLGGNFQTYTYDYANYHSTISTQTNLAFKITSGPNSGVQRLLLDDIEYKSFCQPAANPTAFAKDITAKLDATGNVIVNPASVDNGSTDDCGEFITNFSLDKTLFTCDDLGVNAVTLTATDSEGQTATASANITIEPNFVFNSNQLALDENGESNVDLDFLTQSKTDCNDVTYALDLTNFTCADAGYHLLTVTASYGGMSTTYSATKNLRDYLSPVAVAQDISVSIDETTGVAIVTPEMIDNGSTDNCGITTMTLSKSSFDCADQGENEVTLTVTDDAGLSSTATAMVTVGSFLEDFTLSSNTTTVCFNGSNGTDGVTIETSGSTVGTQYYLRNDADGSVVDGPIDGTGSGLSFNVGTISENSTFQVYGEVPFSGKALDLNASGAHLSVNTPGSFDYSTGYTISAWVKLGASGNSTFYNGIFYVGGATGSDIEMYENSSGTITVLHNRGNGGTQGAYSISGNPITNNTYVHVALTYNGFASRVFVNGVDVGAATLVAPVKSGSSEMTFGHMNSNTFPAAQRFNGLMDDVRVYDKALSASEILADYDKCISGTEDDLVLYYDLESINGSIYTDLVNGTPAQIKNGAFSDDDAAISCSFTCNKIMTSKITIGDDVSPTVVTKNIVVDQSSTGILTIDPEQVNNGSSDNCSASDKLIFALDKSTFGCDDLGAQTVELSVTDEAGNMAVANATVTINRFIADQTVSVTNDNICPGESITISIASSQLDVNYYLRDASNNIIQGPLAGTGNAIDFSTGVFSGNKTYNILAETMQNNQAMELAGTNNAYLSIPNSPSLQLDQNWTLETWVKPTGGFSNYNFIESYDGNGGFILRANSNRRFQAYAMQSSSQHNNQSSNTSYVLDQWVHVAATFDETTNELKIYINGVLDAANPSATVDQRGPLKAVNIGARGDDNNVQNKHEQDEVRIWNVARTEQEISDNMSKILTGKEAGLVAYYNFNNLTFAASDMVIPDATDNANQATILGSYDENSFTSNAVDNQGENCSLQMTVTPEATSEDVINPDAIAQDFTLILGNQTSASISTTDINNGSNDNCTSDENLILSLDVTTFDNTQIGEHTVTLTVMDASGNSNTATSTVTVTDKTPQTVTFEALADKVFGDPDFEIAASASTNLPITYSVISGSVSISGSTVSIIGAGQVTIRASQEGDDTFASVHVDRSFNVAKADQTLTVEEVSDKTVAAAPITINANVDTNLVLEYTLTGPASVSNNIVTLDGTVGTVVVTVNQSGNSNYNSISKTIDFEVVAQTSQVITFIVIEDKIYGVEAVNLIASSDSELDVSLALISGPATLSGTALTITGIGEIIVEASQSGDVTFSAASSVQRSFMVNRAALSATADNQTITYGDDIPALTFVYDGFVNGEGTIDLVAEPTISTDAIASSDAGTYAITLMGGEATNYDLTLVDASLTINKVNQIITIDPIANKEPSDVAFDIVANVDSGLDLSYEISGPATISGTTITLDGSEGTVTVTASQAGDINHNTISESVSFQVAVVLSLEDGLSEGINIYPNPASNMIKIAIDQNLEGTARMYNVRGVEMLSYSLLPIEENEIDLTMLPRGLYILIIQDENTAIIKKQTILINE